MISHEKLCELLRYEPETGKFFWHKKYCNCSQVVVGKEAGFYNHKRKNVHITIYKKRYSRSRLVWFYMTGQWAKEKEIDHKNIDSFDDRWKNLRLASRSDNNANRRIFKNNKVGRKGVHLVKGKYRAMVSVNGKRKHLGYFDRLEDAHAVYIIAATRSYGEFFRQF